MEEENAATQTVNRFQLDRHVDLDDDDVESVGGEEGADSSGTVTYHVYDRSLHSRLRRALVRSPKARMSFAFFDFSLRVAICILYLVRLLVDDPKAYFCHGGPAKPLCDGWNESMDQPEYTNIHISWYVLLWVQRPLPVYILQLILSLITLMKTLLSIYVAPRGHRLKMVWTVSFWVELLVSFPYLITLCYPPLLREIYIPSFLNCWLAKKALQKIFIDLHMTRQKFQTISVTMYQQIIILVASLMCLIFTTICGIEHLQRASYSTNLTLWQSIYFTIVTFSTVGYGDISPDIWPSELFMVIMICVAFATIPRQLEEIAVTFVERQKEGPEYSKRAAAHSKHVVVCSSFFTVSAIMDFLSEFYAHPKFEEHVVILLCPRELDNGMQVILKDPKWAHRVIYMRGSPGKDTDLKRCRIQQAEACFLLAHRACSDKAQADQHTILRSWAVKDFAPACKQYIQLFHAKNKMHIPFAEHVVCEDEFKFALLAHNCLYPGLSTLVALLVHTSAEIVDSLPENLMSDKWQQLYGRHSGNEIYHIQLQKSIFFRQFKGRPFPEASAEAHNLFGVTLVAVLDPEAVEPRLLLNPGPDFLLQRKHYCFYFATQREEHARIDKALVDQALQPQSEDGRPGMDFNRNHIEKLAAVVKRHHPSFSVRADDEDDSVISDVMEALEEEDEEEPCSSGDEADREVRQVGRFHVESPSGEITPGKDTSDPSRLSPSPSQGSNGASQKYGMAPVEISMADGNIWIPKASLTTGPLPVTIATGSRMMVCHIMGKPRDLCCLEWGVHCKHCRYKNASDNRWKEQLVLLAAQRASSGVYNFIIPLRSHFIDKESLQPIILLLEEQPSQMFLETIAQFPLVYWMLGNITVLDDLLKAGINKASHIVVVNREKSPDAEEEETLSDSQTILTVQTIFKMFPNANVITELSQASNMRFMHFRGHDKYCQKISRLEQKLKETMPSTLSHIFRLPFAAGHVFSASMLDTLLYQTFVKGYLITFVRLLLGIDAEKGSGHLSSIQITREKAEQCPTYGDLYKELCATTGEIPIAIYRTQVQGLASLDQKRATIRRVSTVAAHTFDKGVDDNTAELIRSRLCSLDIDTADYQGDSKHAEMISFVICNPTANRSLKAGDIVYVIQPSSMAARPSKPHWWMFPRGRGRRPRRDGDRRGSWPFNHVEGTRVPTPEVDPEAVLLSEPEPSLPVSHHTICGEFLRDPRERGRALDELFSDPQDNEDPQSPKSAPGDVGRSSSPTPGSSGKPPLQKVPPLKLPTRGLGDQEEGDDDSTSSGTFSMSPRRDSGVYDPDSQWEEGERSPVKARSMSGGTASSGSGGSSGTTSPGREVPPVWVKNAPAKVGNGTGSVPPARGVDGKGVDGRQRANTSSSQYTSNESLDSAPLLRRPATSPGAITPAGKGTQPPQFEDTRC